MCRNIRQNLTIPTITAAVNDAAGRAVSYKITDAARELARYGDFHKHPGSEILILSYPKDTMSGHLYLSVGTYGFEPDVYNARSETVADLARWHEHFASRRCVVPLSTFVEGSYQLGRLDRTPMFAAGIMDKAHRVVILTQNSYGLAASAHDRMPVLLEPKSIFAYMRRDRSDFDFAKNEFYREPINAM